MELSLALLGGMSMALDGAPLNTLRYTKAQALLCYLAVTGRIHSRAMLAGLLWSELPDEDARANLRVMLTKLRHVLPDHLQTSRETVTLNREHTCLDVERFLENLHGLGGGSNIARLREAVELYKGDFLEGFYIHDAPLFEEWVAGQRERLKHLALQALHTLAVHHTEQREYTAGIDYLTHLLALDPWREEAHRQLMLLLALSGQREAALVHFESCRRVLAEALGVELGQETHTLAQMILEGKVKAQLPPEQPTLPAPASSLLGRDDELARLQRQLSSSQLLTLTGPGGVGKTRLGLELASRMQDSFADGVYFVSLAAVTDPALVATTIAGVIDLHEVEGKSPEDRLREYLRHRQLLLVLDNFEQITEAAPLVAELLTSCPRLKVLVTSRTPLHLYGEHEFSIPPLPVPDLAHLPSSDDLSHMPSVALFQERALAVKRDFVLNEANAAAVAIICVRLDGLPLAIELAAAHSKLFSPQAILSRLTSRLGFLTSGASNLPRRHQTLRGTIAWSYELLSESEKTIFRRLSSFSGGCTLEAAAYVAEADDVTTNIPEGIASLLDKSLLKGLEPFEGEPRMIMLEVIHEFAHEQLRACGELEEVHRRHAAFFLALAEEADRELRGTQQARWLKLLEAELDNLRSAYAWASQSGEVETALRLAGALTWFWFMRGRFSEGRTWLEGGLSKGIPVAPDLRAEVLCKAGILARRQGDVEAAKGRLEESLALFWQLGDKSGIASSLHHLAHVAEADGDSDKGMALFAQSLTLAREADDVWELTLVLNCLSNAVHEQGENHHARILLEESLLLSRTSGNKHGLGDALRLAGLIALDEGQVRQAAVLLEESLAVFSELGDKQGVGLIVPSLASVALRDNDTARAALLFRENLVLQNEQEDKSGIAKSLEGLAEVAYAEGRFERAARLLGGAEGLCEASNVPNSLGMNRNDKNLKAAVEARLGQEIFTAEWTAGRIMPLEKALAYALETPAFT